VLSPAHVEGALASFTRGVDVTTLVNNVSP